MTIKTYLLGIGASTILCWIAFFLVFINIDPYKATNSGFISFFVSLFFALLGSLMIFFFYTRMKFGVRGIVFSNLIIAFRHALLLSIIIIALLGFQALRVLTLWDGVLFALSILLIEAYFRARWLSN